MTAPDASGRSPPAARQAGLADRRRAIVADIRHDLKNARLAAAAALRQLVELATEKRLSEVIAGLEAAVGELTVHSERGLELLSLGVDDVEPVLQPMALEPILRDVEIARRAAAEQAGIDLRTLPSGAVAAVDAGLLARCVGNLVSNAIEHSGAGKVVVGVRRRGAGCVIEVRDNGRGIDPEALRGMDGRRWAEGAGRGLGLWIAARFAVLLGGELDVRAQAGRGSCFRVVLPGPASWAPGSPRGAHASRVRFDGKIVVLLEDDVAQLEATRLVFERRGATVVAVRTQVELWNEIEQLPRPPDLCVLDFVLGRHISPRREEAMRPTSASDLMWLKKRFNAWTKVVILTANPSHPELAKIGDAPIFEKPLSASKIDAIGLLLLDRSGPRKP